MICFQSAYFRIQNGKKRKNNNNNHINIELISLYLVDHQLYKFLIRFAFNSFIHLLLPGRYTMHKLYLPLRHAGTNLQMIFYLPP